MKLVGKKLYRIGPLKLFKQSKMGDAPGTGKSAMGTKTYGWGSTGSGGGGSRGLTAAEKERMKKFQEEMKKKAWLAEQAKQESAIEKKEWKDEAMRDLYDPEQKALYEKRKQLAEDVGSGAAARRGAEAGLKAQMAAAGAGRGSAAQRMRGLARAGEAGVKGAAAQGAGAAAQQFGMLGQAGQGRFGMQKSDKAGRLGFYQKSRGLDVAEKAAQAQAAATRAANSGGKASGGEIFKEFKRKNGKIEGPGTETSDSIKAMLSDGEFVVNAKTVRGIGESMGAKGKEDSRKKGAGFLYDLQTKYGDKKPVNKAFGGLEIAELASHAAKEGAFGKKMKTVGEVGSAAVDAKKGIDKKKSDLHDKEADVVKKRHQRETEHHTEYAKGGHVNLGKGVKAKRKFREAIGWEADKIFDKKAEKDYKEGHTGYKNWKGDSVVKLGRGGFLGSIGRVAAGAGAGFLMGGPAGAAMGAGKAVVSEKMAADKEKAQKKSNIAMGEAKSQAKQAEAGKAMAADEVQLKDGGEVSKDHPHYKFLKDLDKFTAHHFPKGKKVDLDPGRKADKAIRAKKGSIEPLKLALGTGPMGVSKGYKPATKQYVTPKIKSGDWRAKVAAKVRKENPKLDESDLRRKINKAIVSEKKLRAAEKGEGAFWKHRIAAMEDHHLGKKAKIERKQAESKKKLKGFEKLGESGGRKKDLVGEERKKFLEKQNKLKNYKSMDALQKHKQTPEYMEEQRLKKLLKIRKDAKKAEAEYDKAMKAKKRDAEVRKYEEGVAKDLGITYDQYKKEMASEKYFGPEEKGRRETKSIMKKPEVKEEKGWWDKMSGGDKAGIAMGVGKGLISARQKYLEAKQKRRDAIAAGELEAAKIRGAAGQQLIAAPVSLRKGGRVSFKDVLKAKKKMGY